MRIQARNGRQVRIAHLRYGAALGLLTVVLVGVGRLSDHRQPRTVTPMVLAWVTIDAATLAQAPTLPHATVVSEQVNARSGPGPAYPIVQQLPPHTPFYVVGWAIREDRYLVRLTDDLAAWVRTDPAAVQLAVPRDSLPHLRITP